MEMIDESLYSRQLYAIGKDAMTRIKSTRILISGISGLGIEIAKNIILSGVKSVTVHSVDDNEVCMENLTSNYYVTEADIGKSKLAVVQPKLAKLNPYVNVLTETNDIDENMINSHDIIVICNQHPISQIEINKLCHKNNKPFLLVNTLRGFGSIFCDFGENFPVYDVDGEELKSGTITEILKTNFQTAEPHDLVVGDTITLYIDDREIEHEKITKIINRTSFEINNNYMEIPDAISAINCRFVQEKETQILNFLPLDLSFENPEFINYDLSEEKKTNIVTLLRNELPCDFCPLNSIIGSIAAQEIIKAASNKFMPIKQWFYYDTNIFANHTISCQTSMKDRYISQKIILGEETQKKLKDQHIFIVGAGAIGCELLKNLAMIGIGNITITDMDTIEKSNLNRQFLFSNDDIGKFKSECAKEAINKINPEINITAQTLKVSSETLNVYNAKFFSDKTAVLTALDNTQARLFVDSLCVEYGIPLIDSGTLGAKGNVQVVIPHLTEPYGASTDPPEKSVPMCTLKNFPYLIDHTIQWGRNLFEGLFTTAPANFMRFKKNPESATTLSKSELSEIANDINFVYNNNCCNYEECILFAYKMWHEQFRDQIFHLTKKFPHDMLTEGNIPFWSGTKKFPEQLVFNINNELHLQFIESCANLWADIFGITHKDPNIIKKFLKTKKVPKITDLKGDIKIDEDKNDENSEDIKETTDDDIKLPDLLELDYNIQSLEFEKDDDTNFHIDFITSSSNLRATNYSIPIADKFKTKGIAGKIIPAIATTTSLVSGLVTIELLKIIIGNNKLDQYTNSFINLALPLVAFSEPIEVAKQKIGNYKYTVWDSIHYKNQQLEQLLNLLKEKVGDLNVVFVNTANNLCLMGTHMSKEEKERRLQMKISELYQEVTENENIPDYISLSILYDTDDDSDHIVCKIDT
jgi:ubiquitin-activating enzyme E1